ncbi:hypothetical protein AC26_1481 [Escherichia coli 1-176-05_S3_C2]|nr:hypothetical protein AC26_1481 [Escherichia coli 1-176-05_S3_C2]
MRNVPSFAWCRVPPGESGISIRTRNIAAKAEGYLQPC